MTNRYVASFGVAVSAALLIGHATAATSDYKFQIVGPQTRTTAGATVTVHVSQGSGEAVTNAEMFYISVEQPNPKASFIVKRRVAMRPDGQGNYTVFVRSPVPEGMPLRFVAEVPVAGTVARSVASVSAPPAASGAKVETVEWSTQFHHK